MCWRDDLQPPSYWDRYKIRTSSEPAPTPPPAPRCNVYPEESCTSKKDCENLKRCLIEIPF